jgi:hypothetical protein
MGRIKLPKRRVLLRASRRRIHRKEKNGAGEIEIGHSRNVFWKEKDRIPFLFGFKSLPGKSKFVK